MLSKKEKDDVTKVFDIVKYYIFIKYDKSSLVNNCYNLSLDNLKKMTKTYSSFRNKHELENVLDEVLAKSIVNHVYIKTQWTKLKA